MVNQKTKNIRLYVKRVFISDDFDGELVRIVSVGVVFQETCLSICYRYPVHLCFLNSFLGT